jgi:CheY-like chemotaxis protein
VRSSARSRPRGVSEGGASEGPGRGEAKARAATVCLGDATRRRAACLGWGMATPTTAHVSERPTLIRVAIAHGDEAFRATLAACLRADGYLVTVTHNGRELLDVLKGTPPGFFKLVIADDRMPRLQGLACLAMAGCSAPFVLMSAEDDPRLRAEAARHGAAAVVRKPVALPTLLLLVRDLLAEALITVPTRRALGSA